MHLGGDHESLGPQFALKRGHSLWGNIELVSLGELQRFVAAQHVDVGCLALSQPKNNALLIALSGFTQVGQRLIDGCARASQEHQPVPFSQAFQTCVMIPPMSYLELPRKGSQASPTWLGCVWYSLEPRMQTKGRFVR